METERIESRFPGAAGVGEIYWQAWRAPGTRPRALVVLLHGVSEHSSRYGHVAEAFARAGYATFALDHRGHGRSAGPRAYLDRMDHVLDDVGTLVGVARREHPDVEDVVLFGHSMGGCVALAWAIRHQDELAALVLSAPLAALEAASPATRVAARVASALVPRLGVYRVPAEAVSRDPEVVRDYEADPLNHHGKLPARTVAELATTIDTFEAAAPDLTLPLLIMHGTEDTLTPPAGSKMVADRAGSADKTLELYDGLFHELVNEPERERVIADIVAWLDARTR